MTTTTTTTINKLNSDIIELSEQIETVETATMKALLAQLRDAKIREIELLQRLATKKTSTSSKQFDDDELIVKAIFVALRPHVEDGADNATKAFKAAIAALNIDFNAELQSKIFASSTVHCLKSNFNKVNNNINDSYDSYLETVRQAKLLLPNIDKATWDAWLKSVQEAATRAANKRGISWSVPADSTAEPVQAEPVQAEPVQAEPVQAEPEKKTVITTRKASNKKK